MGGPTIDDAAAGMAGILGTTMMVGVGTAAGMAAVNMIDRMGKKVGGGNQQRKRRRKGKR